MSLSEFISNFEVWFRSLEVVWKMLFAGGVVILLAILAGIPFNR